MAGQLAKKKNTESSGANLSEREVEVLKLVARGYTDKEISEMLNISVKTVEKHKLKIKDKTGSKRLASLIKFAMENGYM
ncbi:helix-turn-helix transcriptional regulator [Desulfosporosinus nitroreducens]|uniref:helix-turn-helix transcriptional regulator n=1 Tax=Desulfosporosinus nitroreducens TaxID=2018668 RepID=UPI0025AA294B|nr:LuxR C-terminal-related transcriptional regulator [Desulfosporosinus nitroreducens]